MPLYADSLPKPHEIPADAVAVIAFRENEHPKRWELVCLGTGYTTLPEIMDAVSREFRDLDGVPVLVSKIGGNAGRVRRLRRNETVTVEPTEEAVEAPAEPG